MLTGDFSQFGIHATPNIIFHAAQVLSTSIQEVSQALEDTLIALPGRYHVADDIEAEIGRTKDLEAGNAVR